MLRLLNLSRNFARQYGDIPAPSWSLTSLLGEAGQSALSDAEITRLETLSALRNTGSEEELRRDVSRVLQFVKQVQSVDTRNVKPLVSLVQDVEIPLRKDVITEGGCPDEILKNSAAAVGRFFVVPSSD